MFFSIVIATHNRERYLKACLDSILVQKFIDFEVIIAHSGADDGTTQLIEDYQNPKIKYIECKLRGAASQRNEGVELARGEWILFLDDDVVLQSDFLNEINMAITKYPEAGGISGRIDNQFFTPPGTITKFILSQIGVNKTDGLAGKVVGPCLNFLPEKEGPEYEEIDWMPTCVCAYKKKTFHEAEGFSDIFKDYSFAEDLHLSMKVREKHQLILARSASLFHNDQGGQTHTDFVALAKMHIKNRMFIINDLNLMEQKRAIKKLLFWHRCNAFIMLIKGNMNLRGWFEYTKGLILEANNY